MTIVTSRGDVGFSMCWYQCPRIGVCHDLHSYTVFHFAWGMLKTRVSTTRILLDRRLGSITIWGNFWGNNNVDFWGDLFAKFKEPYSKGFLSGLTQISPTALLIAHILISDFRYDYCG